MSELKVTQGARQCQAVLCCKSAPGEKRGKRGPKRDTGDRCWLPTCGGSPFCWVHEVAKRDGMLPKDRQVFVPKAQ